MMMLASEIWRHFIILLDLFKDATIVMVCSEDEAISAAAVFAPHESCASFLRLVVLKRVTLRVVIHVRDVIRLEARKVYLSIVDAGVRGILALIDHQLRAVNGEGTGAVFALPTPDIALVHHWLEITPVEP